MDHQLTPIDKLFMTLAATYGSAWDRSLGIAPVDEVKAIWRKHLTGFVSGDIKYALDHLPSKCPNVLEFRDLCRAAPRAELLKVTHQPKPDPEKVAEVVGVVKSKLTQLPKADPKDWARKLKARHDKGEKLAAHQIAAYRQALGFEGRQSWQ